MYALSCRCQYPGCTFPAFERRQITCYANDSLNYATLCVEHHVEADEYWKDMWREYYNSLGAPHGYV